MKFTRLTAAAIAAMTLFASQAHAAWPEDKPIEVVVGFSDGGGTDLMARTSRRSSKSVWIKRGSSWW